MPFPVPPVAAVGLIGILVQLGACLLATTLVFGARRSNRQLEYLAWWSWAWVAVSLAIAVIAIRYLVMPQVAPSAVRPEVGPLLIPIYLLYQTFKLLFLGFVGLGIHNLIAGRPVTGREVVLMMGSAVLLGAGSVALTRDLNLLVMIQAVVAVPTFAIGAWTIGHLPPARRGFGSRTLTIALLVLAIQWSFYLQGFAFGPIPPTGPYRTFLAYLIGYNSYLDAGQLTHLGIGMVLLMVDWTHREAEGLQASKLRETAAAEQRLADVLRAAREGIVTLTPDHRIDLANPAAIVILGLERTTARGEDFDRFVHDADRKALWDDLAVDVRRSEARPRAAIRREVKGLRLQGDEFPLEISISSLAGDAGSGYVLVLRDLTEQFSEREAHEQLRNQLAQTARLEAVGRMVSGVAHELNNPLTAIIAFAQDLLLHRQSGEDREALTVIMQQADRCRVIVGDLLIFARSRREERHRVNPHELVHRVARVFDRNSASYGVALDLEVATKLPPIEVDPAGIEQVLTNLLTNALQASPRDGRIGLAVAVRGDRVEFRVEDNGPGIPPDALPRLFEPFFTTKGPGEGTGLGLSVSHAIVQQHGGSIEAGNRDGGAGGARFVVRLPFVERRTEPIVDPGQPPAAAKAPGAGGARALVVDDEPAIRVAIRRALERRGWIVDEAGDGFEAWLRLEVGGRPADYDVIITDLRMPGMSGIELVEKLRAEHPSLADRTLVITGDTASPQVVDFLASLKTPFLQKPFDMQTVLDRIERLRSSSNR